MSSTVQATEVRIFLCIAFLLAHDAVNCQVVKPDLHDASKWTAFNRMITSVEDGERKVVALDENQGGGMYILKDYNFSEGEIEVDIRGRDVEQKSFVGIAFHIQNDSAYDAVYFRPFNFKPGDSIKRYRAVQYISPPDYEWYNLREKFPRKYESSIAAMPLPGDWFHARIKIEGNTVTVFVNDATVPCLKVHKLTETRSGQIALWVGNGSDGQFANLRIAKRQ